MYAARNGNPDAIKALLEAGADVNATENLRGTTALMWAAEQKHPLAVKALLEGGADFRVRSGPAGLPRNYMAMRVLAGNVEAARKRRLAAAAAGRTYQEQLEFERANGISTGGRGFTPGPGQRGAAGAVGAAPAPDPDDEVIVGGSGGLRGRRPDGAGLCGPRRRSGVRQAAARRRRRREPDDRVWLDSAAHRDEQQALQAGNQSDRARRRREHRQQGRLDAPLSGDGQPQYRRRRLSGAEGGHGPSRFHQGPAGSRSEPQRPDQGRHAQSNHLHDAVVLRIGRHAIRARRAVERYRSDAAPPEVRGRSEDADRLQRHRADGRCGHRLGRGCHVRTIGDGQRGRGEDAAGSRAGSERGEQRRPHAADGRSAQGQERGRAAPGGSRRQARDAGQGESRYRHRGLGARRPHLAGGGLRRWSRSRGRAVCRGTTRDGGAHSQSDDRAWNRRSTVKSHD